MVLLSDSWPTLCLTESPQPYSWPSVNCLPRRLSIVLRTRTIKFKADGSFFKGDNFVRFMGRMCLHEGGFVPHVQIEPAEATCNCNEKRFCQALCCEKRYINVRIQDNTIYPIICIHQSAWIPKCIRPVRPMACAPPAPLANSAKTSTLAGHFQLEDETVREKAGHPPSYAEAKAIKSLKLHSHGCPRDSLRGCSFSSVKIDVCHLNCNIR